MTDLGKFKTLPGIAVNEPDVYETGDLPEAEQATATQPPYESDLIDVPKLDVVCASQSFKGKSVLTDSADFSDAVHVRKRGYGIQSLEYELAKESVEETFERLKAELSALSASVKDPLKSDSEKNSVTQSAIDQLQEQLKHLQLEQILGTSYEGISAGNADTAKSLFTKLDAFRQPQKAHPEKAADSTDSSRTLFDITFSPASTNVSQSSKVCDLENRLAKLESLVGNNPEEIAKLAVEFQGKGLSNVISVMAQKIKMLDVNNLDVVEARLNAVLTKVNQIREKRSSSTDPETIQKVNEMYELTCKWDELCSCLPHIVSRMKAVSGLHEQALQFSQALSHLNMVQQQLTKTLDANASLLGETRTSMVENVELIKGNLESLDKRLKALQK